jgi:SAM-dependent methyltransferase
MRMLSDEAAATDIHEQVRRRYAQAATEAASGAQPGIVSGCGEGGCCAPDEAVFGSGLYGTSEQGELPEQAVLASLGCGNPTAVAELREGETVLDLGSGGGIDVLLSARRVGPGGKAYGLDMTEEMLALARHNAAEAGATNGEFLKGRIEEIPLPAETIDVVISNCVVNLSPDKPAVLRETFRVLRPGGRIGISDVVAEDRLTAEDRAERGGWAGCIAGALSLAEYRALVVAAGFADVGFRFTHEVADGLHGAIVSGVKPVDAPGIVASPAPGDAAGCC